MLQVAERASGAKRRALLVAEIPPVQAASMAEDAFAQRQFQGEAFDRMKADPELVRAGQRFFYGVAGVSALVVVVTVWNLWLSWGTVKAAPVASMAPVHETQKEPVEEKRSHLPPMLSKPLDIESMLRERQQAALMSAPSGSDAHAGQ